MSMRLAELARASIASGDFKEFRDALATESLPQSFAILSDKELFQVIAQQMECSDPAECVLRPTTWNSEVYNPHAEFRSADQLLQLLWQDLSTKLALKLAAASRQTLIANQGAVLCFFGCAALRLIVRYKRSPGGAVELQPLAIRHEPNAILELSEMLEAADPAVRSALKHAALSVDKVVYQRGSIVHVNRVQEDVFGPTIDTVVLGELIAELLGTASTAHTLSALEIGAGSGLISAILAGSDRVGELTAIDLNPAAAVCTLKNLAINGIHLDAMRQHIRVRAERFSASQFASPFDFIVCNPPYLPDSESHPMHVASEIGRAVADYELGIEILKSLPKILADDGTLLMMTTSVSRGEVLSAVPEGFEAVPALTPEGRRVPLDVELLWRYPEWRETLLQKGCIEKEPDGNLWHRICPMWIRRRARESRR